MYTLLYKQMGGQVPSQGLTQANLKDYLSCIHPNLKTAQLIQTTQGPILQHRLLIQPGLQLDSWLDKQDHFQENLTSRYLFVPQKIAIQKGHCSTQETLCLYFEFFPFCLDKEILLRRTTNRKFPQSELWYLLYTGLCALAEFQKLDQRLGRVCPQNILMNTKGHVRFVNVYSWPGQPLCHVPGPNTCYLSPQDFRQHDLSKKRSGVFSLGMVIVQCITLQGVGKVYRDNRFNKEQFYTLVQQLALNKPALGGKFLKILHRTLALEIEERPFASVLLGQLKPYESKILKFHPLN